MTTTTGTWTQGPRWSSWPAWPGTHLRPVAIRYSWPAELDLMADRAGLRLTERHADWDRRPFTSASDSHVSVYQRA
jgi:hypothetical protein